MPTPVGHALGGFACGWLIAAADGQTSAAGDRQQRTASTATPSSTLTRIRHQLHAGWRRAALFAALGALPDIDLLFHAHSTYTHSLGAALLAALVAWAIAASRPASTPDASTVRPVRPVPPAVMALACGAAWASHVLLDWLGTDRSPPSGITALWPFSSAYYYSALDIFPAVDRRYWLPGFWQRALNSVSWELIVLLPVTALVFWLRAPAASRTPAAPHGPASPQEPASPRAPARPGMPAPPPHNHA
jgi:membrane-bound metal-dependent hydrolase YbcI (DUF457 family)